MQAIQRICRAITEWEDDWMVARFHHFLLAVPMEGDLSSNAELAAIFRVSPKNLKRLGALKWAVDAWRRRDI